MQSRDAKIIEELYALVLSRKGADPDSSYTASLYHKGRNKIAQKVGEEAVETVIAALGETRAEVITESADLLYHLCVLWAEQGVDPQEIFAELHSRHAQKSNADP